MNTLNIFVTGGTGLIGRWTVARLSQQGHRVKILVRNAQQRKTKYSSWIQAHGGNSQTIDLLDGDLSKANLGLSEESQRQLADTEIIYHMGAAFIWGLSPEQARKITVDGSRELMGLASRLPKLTQLVHLSGYMLAAAPIWQVLGLDHNKQDATKKLSEQQINRLYKKYGAYEAAKIESHFLIHQLAHENNIPLTGILLSSAIGDSQTGEIDQPHGIPMLVNSIWNNTLPVIPGTKEDWVPLVTVDYLVDYITGILRLPETINKSYVVLDDETPTFAEFIGLISQHIGNKAPTRFIPIPLVQFFLNLGLDKFLGSSAETLDFVKPDQFDTLPAQQIAQKLNLKKPDIHQAILHMVDYLVDTNFGKNTDVTEEKNAQSSTGKFHRIANTQTFISGNRDNVAYVYLHGMPFNSKIWNSLKHQLTGTSMAVDIPNVSSSKGSYLSRTSWMNSLLSNQNEKTHLITHSIGTGFAVDYASRYPERVNKMVLISPYFFQGKAGFTTHIPFIGSLLKLALNKSQFSRLVVGDVTNPVHIDNAFTNTRRPGVFATIMRSLKQAKQTKHRQALQEKLNGIQVPTLIIHGTNDPLIEQVADNPNIEVLTIDGAGHNPHLSHEKEVLSAIKGFTSGHKASENKTTSKAANLTDSTEFSIC